MRQVSLENATDTGSLAIVEPQGSSLVLMFERLAKDPAVDVEKLQKLIELQERIMRHQAKSAFDAAFARMAPKLPEIDEHGKILVKGQVRSTFAKLEDIHKVIKPILSEHGFAIRHRTEWPADKNVIRVVGILSHEQGHSEESIFEAPPDVSEFRSDIQSMGSTVSYGRRYSTIDLLNLTTRGVDKDGQKPEAKVEAPKGFEEWWLDMSAVADNGLKALTTAWNDEKAAPFRKHVFETRKDAWNDLKTKAAKVRE